MGKILNLGKDTFVSLRIRNFRLYFLGQAISLSGTWMQQIAQAWLVLDLTHSGTILGLVTAAQTLPILLFGPLGGLVADCLPKRRILYFTQAGAAILALILGILVYLNLIQVWMVFLLAIFLGFVNCIDNPTRQTFIVEMVGNGELSNAVSLNSSMVNLARIIGPALGGTLILTVGLSICFILNGLSYIPVIFMLYKMRQNELHLQEQIKKSKGQLIQGFKYVWSRPILRDTLIILAAIGTLSFEFQVSLPLFAQITFKGGAGSYAALSSMMGLGAVLGGLYSARRKKNSFHSLTKSALWFGLSVLLLGVSPNLPVALILASVMGFFSINYMTTGNVTLQMESESAMRGRVMSLWTVAFLGSTPIGGPIIGFIGQSINPRVSLLVGALAAILASSFGFLAIRKDSTKYVPSRVESSGERLTGK